jgi:hypothetical protein
LATVGAESPADDAPGVDTDHLARHIGIGGRLVAERLGCPADLKASDHPRVEQDDVVDHEGDLPVGRHVAELAAVTQVPAADVDHSVLRIDVETDGVVLQGPVRREGGQPAEALGAEVLEFGLARSCRGDWPGVLAMASARAVKPRAIWRRAAATSSGCCTVLV